ncbi:N-acetylmuramidase family protein [Acinetobacter sp. HY1485]|uniref:N-acetylmuramidase family protein n=1 Tax=Acinetobacter sp. HY1485 TaxID=2970918 RepID=UPI0022B9A252|nr:N-acetylmuramidase family protein [Acinetobacter sp. HY1485]
MIYKYGATGLEVLSLQKNLKRLGLYNGELNSYFNGSTEKAVMAFQRQVGLVADGKVGDKTRLALAGQDTNKYLQDRDYQQAAQRLNVSELAIRVFGAVEGLGRGFLDDGRPKILFERHRMYFYLKQKYGEEYAKNKMAKLPNIVNVVTGGYVGNSGEYARLEQAKQIDEDCALMACSWGEFQIMGENYKTLGYASIQEFVKLQFENESYQLDAFLRFVETKTGKVGNKAISLLEALQKEDWEAVFTLYNGSAYKKLGYQAKFQKQWDHLEPLYKKDKLA